MLPLGFLISVPAVYLLCSCVDIWQQGRIGSALDRLGAASLVQCAALDPCLFIGVAFLGWAGDLDFTRTKTKVMVLLFLLGPTLFLVARRY